jgi:hypothetical protein
MISLPISGVMVPRRTISHARSDSSTAARVSKTLPGEAPMFGVMSYCSTEEFGFEAHSGCSGLKLP